jgi:hypothetical protein
MTLKSPAPLCKVCGKPIPKTTTTHNFGCRVASRRYESVIDHTEKPATRAEAQRLVNGEIISIRRQGYQPSSPDEIPRGGITSAHVWDGESYAWGGHFHAQGCAAQFGLGMAKQFPDHATPAHREAVAAQKAGAQ